MTLEFDLAISASTKPNPPSAASDRRGSSNQVPKLKNGQHVLAEPQVTMDAELEVFQIDAIDRRAVANPMVEDGTLDADLVVLRLFGRPSDLRPT